MSREVYENAVAFAPGARGSACVTQGLDAAISAAGAVELEPAVVDELARAKAIRRELREQGATERLDAALALTGHADQQIFDAFAEKSD